MDPEVRQAYVDLENAIKGVLEVRGIEGLLIEHFTIVAVQEVDDEGDFLTGVKMLLPQGGGLPYHRVMGLVDYVQTLLRAEVANNELEGRGDGGD